MANNPIDAKSTNTDVAAVRGENTVQGGSGVVGISPGGSVPEPFGVGAGAAVLGSAGFNGIGVFGGATGPAIGVLGNCKDAPPDVGVGVVGQGDSGTGVQGTGGIAGVSGSSTLGSGVLGVSDMGQGVLGKSRTNHAVQGESVAGRGVVGISSFVGVTGTCQSGGIVGGIGVAGDSVAQGGFGVTGASASGIGVWGKSSGSSPGVQGDSGSGPGVLGNGNTSDGVVGRSTSAFGVFGASVSGVGIRAVSETGRAFEAQAKGNGQGVVAQSNGGDGVLGISGTGVGVHGKGGQLAGLFEGDVTVTGKITVHGDIVLANADCAEDFDISGQDPVEPGTVMVLGSEGSLSASQRAYDKRVAGVISGAGDYRPGIVLDQRGTKSNRQPIALLGKVFCKVDAQFGAIEIGDLLTTSPTPGHAMKTSNPFEAFGAVIGKALKPLSSGQGLIPILITLQ